MFTQLSAAEALRAGREARNAMASQEAERMTEVLAPWFTGLDLFLYPFRTDPVVPGPTLHEQNETATTWATSVLSLDGSPVSALVTSMFVAQDSPVVILDMQSFIGSDPSEFEIVQDRIQKYASATLGEAGYFTAQTTMLWKATP